MGSDACGARHCVDARRGRLLFLLNRRRQSRRRLRLTRPQLSTQLLRQHVELVRFDSVRFSLACRLVSI
ncbi:Porphobilinogen deaminase [Trichinella spiralis]|uniref:Porphobilinogen deaminase n=1 Tax=Trichinella spiralis TaxID=6334 RepID=A0ABR3KJ30_TRISP